MMMRYDLYKTNMLRWIFIGQISANYSSPPIIKPLPPKAIPL